MSTEEADSNKTRRDQDMMHHQQLEERVAELSRWRQEQLEAESLWDPQEVADALGIQLGKSIRAEILPKIRELKAERDEADRQAGKLLRENRSLRDDQIRHNDWLARAKDDWGAPFNTSFDVVWKEALAMKARLSILEENPTLLENRLAALFSAEEKEMLGRVFDVLERAQDRDLEWPEDLIRTAAGILDNADALVHYASLLRDLDSSGSTIDRVVNHIGQIIASVVRILAGRQRNLQAVGQRQAKKHNG